MAVRGGWKPILYLILCSTGQGNVLFIRGKSGNSKGNLKSDNCDNHQVTMSNMPNDDSHTNRISLHCFDTDRVLLMTSDSRNEFLIVRTKNMQQD